MILLRTLLGWILAVLVALVLVLSVFILPLFVRMRSWDAWAKFLCRRLVNCFGIRVEVEGLEHWPGDGAILVANHVNLLDPFLLYGWLPGFFRGLEQRQHFSWPVWGWVTRRLGNIALDQGGGAAAGSALLTAGQALAEGTSLLVFPEGHRSRDGRLRMFYRGAFRLAQRCNVPLVPIVQSGSWEAFGKGKGRAVGGTVRLRIQPAWTDRAAGITDSQFMNAVEDVFRDVLGEPR